MSCDEWAVTETPTLARMRSMIACGPWVSVFSGPGCVIVSTKSTEYCMRIHSDTGRCTRPSMQLIAVANVPTAMLILHISMKRSTYTQKAYHMCLSLRTLRSWQPEMRYNGVTAHHATGRSSTKWVGNRVRLQTRL